jgi:pullulanase
MEWKPLLDDTWARGPNYHVSPGQTTDIYPHFIQTTGTYSRAFELTSKLLNNTRGIWIYLPPSYVENTLVNLPVVYMHDGQNLFDPAASFAGQTWQVQQTIDAAAEKGDIAEAVVVGIENTSDRMNEYTPWADPAWNTGGKGDLYLQSVVEELMPVINAKYRVLTGPSHTAMMGSSLGGIISSYAGVKYPGVFGMLGIFSPTTWWDNLGIVSAVEGTKAAGTMPLRVYVDSGDSGTLDGEPPNDDVLDTKKLAQAYRDVGYVDNQTLLYVVQAGGTHDEAHWAQRLPGALQLLLGARGQ